MKRMVSLVVCTMFLVVSAAGCSGRNGGTDAEPSDTVAEDVDESKAQTEDLFTKRDYETAYDEESCVKIRFDKDTAQTDGDGVMVDGSTITIKEEAVYLLSGSLEDGTLIVDADESAKIRLVLDGVSIHSETSAAICVQEADKVFITLADDTENELSNGGAFQSNSDSKIDGALFSKQDLTVNGTGTLTVTSPAGHGIVCKDDFAVTGGTIAISAASHGIDANDSVRITGETSFDIQAGKDGIHAEHDEDETQGFVYLSGGTVAVEAQGDGISASSTVQIEDGNIEILTGGGNENGTKDASDEWGAFRGGPGGDQRREPDPKPGEVDSISSISDESEHDEDSTSMKGIKAAGTLTVTGGTFSIDSADDAIHSNDTITVGGGTFEIDSGDDAFHADETLVIMDGAIRIGTCYEGLEAQHLDIQGGTIALTASDDGLNAAGGVDDSGMSGGRDGRMGGGGMSGNSDGSIQISGGDIQITASGDGIDANGSLEISGGQITVTGPTQGDTSTLDYDTTATIMGGTFIGTGASGMAQTFSSAKQGVIAVKAGSLEAGTVITVTDADGNVLLEHTPELSFDVVIFSSPDLVSGETYTLSIGETDTQVEAN